MELFIKNADGTYSSLSETKPVPTRTVDGSGNFVDAPSVSKSKRVEITPSGQADTSINANECIGTLQTLTGVLETGIESGILTSLGASFDTQQTGILDAYVFNAIPASTVTDGSPFVFNSVDLPKFMGMFPLAPIGQLGTSGVTTTYDSGPLYQAIAGTTSGVLYVVLVAETAMTLTANDWLSLRVGVIRD